MRRPASHLDVGVNARKHDSYRGKSGVCHGDVLGVVADTSADDVATRAPSRQNMVFEHRTPGALRESVSPLSVAIFFANALVLISMTNGRVCLKKSPSQSNNMLRIKAFGAPEPFSDEAYFEFRKAILFKTAYRQKCEKKLSKSFKNEGQARSGRKLENAKKLSRAKPL